MDLTNQLEEYMQSDSHGRFDYLPPVEMEILKQIMNSDNPIKTLDDFIATISDASDQTRAEIRLQYWVQVLSMTALENLREYHEVGDIMLPNSHLDIADRLESASNAKIKGGRTDFLKVGLTAARAGMALETRLQQAELKPMYHTILSNPSSGKTAFLSGNTQDIGYDFNGPLEIDAQRIKEHLEAAIEFNEKQRQQDIIRIVVCDDCALESEIISKLPEHMQGCVEIINLKGTESLSERMAELDALGSQNIIAFSASHLDKVLPEHDVSRRLEEARLMLKREVRDLGPDLVVPPEMFFTESSPIYNPRQRGRKKGGFKGGHRY